MIKLKDVAFFGFSREELAEIRKEISAEDILTLETGQTIADLLERDTATMILPGCRAAIVKMEG